LKAIETVKVCVSNITTALLSNKAAQSMPGSSTSRENARQTWNADTALGKQS